MPGCQSSLKFMAVKRCALHPEPLTRHAVYQQLRLDFLVKELSVSSPCSRNAVLPPDEASRMSCYNPHARRKSAQPKVCGLQRRFSFGSVAEEIFLAVARQVLGVVGSRGISTS
jgi:hypothetical protein